MRPTAGRLAGNLPYRIADLPAVSGPACNESPQTGLRSGNEALRQAKRRGVQRGIVKNQLVGDRQFYGPLAEHCKIMPQSQLVLHFLEHAENCRTHSETCGRSQFERVAYVFTRYPHGMGIRRGGGCRPVPAIVGLRRLRSEHASSDRELFPDTRQRSGDKRRGPAVEVAHILGYLPPDEPHAPDPFAADVREAFLAEGFALVLNLPRDPGDGRGQCFRHSR